MVGHCGAIVDVGRWNDFLPGCKISAVLLLWDRFYETGEFMLHVVLCINDKNGGYYKHALVTMVSALENATCQLTFHILHDDTLLPNIQYFEETVARYGQSVYFHNLKKRDFAAITPDIGRWGIGALYKLVLHEYVEADTALYLDCDIVVTLDLAQLLAVDMRNHAIAVVRDFFATKKTKEACRHTIEIGVPLEQYFNTGVMLCNIATLRTMSEELAKETMTSLLTKDTCLFAEQGALNIFYAKRPEMVRMLDEKFNCQINYFTQEAYFQDFDWYKGKVIHYATPKKPWHYFSHAAMVYWKYYTLAFPQENVFALIEACEQHKFTALCRLMVSSPKLRAYMRRYRDRSEEGLWQSIRKRIFPNSASG